ncbi:DUF2029 domain-containing protein [Actinoplanes sp. LDG1-06]|uniref:DUF2029 domain-containing protein n=1 Tax=Paractinoplanes ovalisporus TaxID=2810368 RepID=A0ABS2AH71_9ACTN|nr:mannosyltransferase family protein [Actinoplanes ovalisporus]MBM2618559.1 DUF2029 domain-containing protein [Actinoplanes ovalisporus]
MTDLLVAPAPAPVRTTAPWQAAFRTALAVWSAVTVVHIAVTVFSRSSWLSWNNWDAQHYVTIAEVGYHVGPGYPAFFPLYPLLIRVFDPLLPGGGLISALVVANAAAIGALALLHRLADHEFGPGTAQRAAWYLAASPMGFFLFIGYNESLFLLLTIGSLYAARRGHWWLAGSLGTLASGTRLFGVLLMLPLAIEYLRQNRRIRADVLGIALVPLGVVAYSLYCWWDLGSPLAFSIAQDQWGRRYTFPGEAWFIAVGQADGTLGNGTLGAILDAGSILAAVVLLILCVRGRFRFRPDQSYLIAYGGICLVLLMSTEVGGRAMQSAPRYAMEAVAVVLVLARIGARPLVDRLVLTSGFALHAALLMVFMSGTFLIA